MYLCDSDVRELFAKVNDDQIVATRHMCHNMRFHLGFVKTGLVITMPEVCVQVIFIVEPKVWVLFSFCKFA